MLGEESIQVLRGCPSDELRDLSSHIASVLAERHGLEDTATVFERIASRLRDLRRRAS